MSKNIFPYDKKPHFLYPDNIRNTAIILHKLLVINLLVQIALILLLYFIMVI